MEASATTVAALPRRPLLARARARPAQRADHVSRRLDVQGLRAIAVLMVVLFHAGVGVPGGFAGVDVFFAISGFVIASSLLAEFERTGRISLPRFYLRRVKRLLPALAAVVAFVALAGSLATPAAAIRITGLTGVFASVFAANLYLGSLPNGYFSVSTQLDPLLHTWTLAVEEQFYLVFPALLFAAWWFGARRGRRARAAAFIIVAAFGVESLLLAERAAGEFPWGGYYGAPTRAWEFAAGCLIALSAGLWRRLPRPAAAAVATLALSSLGYVALMTSEFGGLSRVVVLPVVAACALIAAGCASNSITPLLGLRPLTWIGDRSYSIYLWHWPLIVFAGALFPATPSAAKIAAAASIIPACASYRFLENPVRHSPRLRGRVVLALAAVCMVIPASLSYAAARIPDVAPAAFGQGGHLRNSGGCDDTEDVYGSRSRARCVWPVANPRGSVVLVGDSNAGHFSEPFVRAANRAGFSATIATPHNCPFFQLGLVRRGYEDHDCGAFNADELATLIRLRPNLVVIADRLDGWIRNPQYRVGRPNGALTGDSDTKETLLAADRMAQVGALSRASIPVVVIHPIPGPADRKPRMRCCAGPDRPLRRHDQSLAGSRAARPLARTRARRSPWPSRLDRQLRKRPLRTRSLLNCPQRNSPLP